MKAAFYKSLIAGVFFISQTFGALPWLEEGWRCLSPGSALLPGTPLTSEEIEEILFRKAYRETEKSFKYYAIEKEEDFFGGSRKPVSRTELPYPEGRNIYITSNVGAKSAWLKAAQQTPGVNLFVLPPSHNNLIFDPAAKQVQVKRAIFINKEGQLIDGEFETPVPVHAGYHVGENNERLDAIGFPLLNSMDLVNLTSRKSNVKEILQEFDVPVPDGATLFNSARANDIRQQLRQGLVLNGIKGKVVIKPDGLYGGRGVRMFDNARNDFDEIFQHLQFLFQQVDMALVEERITPRPFFNNEGRLMDWNLRVLVTEDAAGNPIVADMEVRAAPLSGEAVNVHNGAVVYQLDTVMSLLGIQRYQYKAFKSSVEQISLKTASALKEALNEEKEEEEKPARIGLLGLDIILDDDFYPFVMEVNTGSVGGFGSLAKIRFGEKKYAAALPVVRHLAVTALKETTLNENASGKEILFNRENFAVWTGIAEHYESVQNKRRALWAYQKAEESEPSNDIAASRIGKLFQQLDDLENAEKYFLKAFRLAPLKSIHTANLAFFYQETGNTKKAEQILLKGVSLFPEHQSLYYQLAKFYDGEKRWEDLEQLMLRAITVFPETARFQHNLGYALKKQKKYVEAAGHFHQALELDPYEVSSMCELGHLFQLEKQFAEAKRYFHQALKTDRNHPDALSYYAAFIYDHEGRGERAKFYLNKVLEMNPNHEQALAYLGLIALSENDLVTAREYYLQLLEINPRDVRGLVGAASVWMFAGEADKAVLYMRRAEEVDPDSPELLTVKESFNTLIQVDQVLNEVLSFDQPINRSI